MDFDEKIEEIREFIEDIEHDLENENLLMNFRGKKLLDYCKWQNNILHTINEKIDTKNYQIRKLNENIDALLEKNERLDTRIVISYLEGYLAAKEKFEK